MTAEDKVGQLFWQLTASQEEDYLRELMEKYHLGGCRYNGMPGSKVLAQNRILQQFINILDLFIKLYAKDLALNH